MEFIVLSVSIICILGSLIVHNAFLQSSRKNFQVWLLKPSWCLSGRWWLLWWWGAWWHLRLAACASFLYWPTQHFHFTIDCFVSSVYAALLSKYNCTFHLKIFTRTLFSTKTMWSSSSHYFHHGIICTSMCTFLETLLWNLWNAPFADVQFLTSCQNL